MEIIKNLAINLVLDNIDKDFFEKKLYEKVAITTNLTNNKLLFDLITINYRNENYKSHVAEVIKEFISDEAFIIFKVNNYANCIINSDDTKNIVNYLSEIMSLFEYEDEYSLMWSFYDFNERIDWVQFNNEKEEAVINELQKFCTNFCIRFSNLFTIEEKEKLLFDDFKNEEIKDIEKKSIKIKEEKFVSKEMIVSKDKISILKKWYNFWK